MRLGLYSILNFLHSRDGREVLDPISDRVRRLSRVASVDPFEYHSQHSDGGFFDRLVDHCTETTVPRFEQALPVAVTTALSDVADDQGTVDESDVRAKFGSVAASLFVDIETKLSSWRQPQLPINIKFNGASMETIAKIARSIPRGFGRDRMPLLGELSRLLGKPDLFKGWKMASLSHLFATRPALYYELEANGMERKNHFISGKGYSKNSDVTVALRADGWDIDRSLFEQKHYQKGGKFDDDRAKQVLARLFEGVDPKTSMEKFLLLDDGANLLIALHEHFPEYAHLCRCVEQTEHGILRIEAELFSKGRRLLCPVINMARSELKKKFESPIIGEAVMHSVDTALAEIHPSLGYLHKEAALLGFGAVNQSVADALLERGLTKDKIWVWDKDPKKRALAVELGFRTAETKKEVLEHGFLCVTSTGHTTIPPEDYLLLPAAAIAVNAGSGNHELGMDQIDVYQTEVANLPGDRRLSRFKAPLGEHAPLSIEQHAKTTIAAIAHVERRGERVPRTMSLIGYDANAKKAVELFRAAGFAKRDIVVWDKDEERRREAERDGFRVVDRATAIQKSGLVLTDGENALDVEELHQLRKGVVLLHHGPTQHPLGTAEEELSEPEGGTSRDRRRSLQRDQDIFRGFLIDNALDRAGDEYRHRVLENGAGNSILVLRSGYVINMEIGIPPEYVQLILGMLQAGCIQATKETEPILHTLKHQDVILKRFERNLALIGRSLTRPSFKGLIPAI